MNLHWLLFVAAMLVVAQIYVYRWWGLKGVTYTRFFDVSKCREGDTVYLIERVANRKLLPLPWLRLESQIPAALQFQQTFDLDISSGDQYQNHKSVFSLLPYKQITRKHTVFCTKRGCYRLNSAFMSCGDLFGWFRHAVRLQFDVELLVHPKPLPLHEMRLPSHSWQGDMTVKRWIVEDPFRIAGVREYRPGDSFRNIHWKATARSGIMQVHQNEFTADHRMMIVLNFETDETMWKAVLDPELIERGIRYAASFAHIAISRGMEVGFACNGRSIDLDDTTSLRLDPKGGNAQLERINDAMARLLIERTTPFDTFLEEEVKRKTRDYDYLIISAFENVKMKRRLLQLEQNGNSVRVWPLAHPKSAIEVEKHA